MKRGTLATVLFALTTFASAFLLFQVQPLLSKRLLPWFGGGPAVWTTCVLFFQTVLFAGYAYAHASEHWLPRVPRQLFMWCCWRPPSHFCQFCLATIASPPPATSRPRRS